MNSAPGPHDSVTAFSGSWPSTWATTWPVHLSLHHSSLFLALSASGPSLPSLALLFSVPQLNQNGKAEDRLGGTLRSNPKPPLMFITSLTCRHLCNSAPDGLLPGQVTKPRVSPADSRDKRRWVEGNSCALFPVPSFLLRDVAPEDWGSQWI